MNFCVIFCVRGLSFFLRWGKIFLCGGVLPWFLLWLCSSVVSFWEVLCWKFGKSLNQIQWGISISDKSWRWHFNV